MKRTWDWKKLKFKGLQWKCYVIGASNIEEYIRHPIFGWSHQQTGVALFLGFCYLWWGYK